MVVVARTLLYWPQSSIYLQSNLLQALRNFLFYLPRFVSLFDLQVPTFQVASFQQFISTRPVINASIIPQES
jgi:hypothetical protein